MRRERTAARWPWLRAAAPLLLLLLAAADPRRAGVGVSVGGAAAALPHLGRIPTALLPAVNNGTNGRPLAAYATGCPCLSKWTITLGGKRQTFRGCANPDGDVLPWCLVDVNSRECRGYHGSRPGGAKDETL